MRESLRGVHRGETVPAGHAQVSRVGTGRSVPPRAIGTLKVEVARGGKIGLGEVLTLIERATEVAQSVIGQDPSRDAQEGPGIENTPDLPDFMYLSKQAMISFRFFHLL
jgi:hypothetical protein